MQFFRNKPIIIFLLKFVGIFCFLYFGTLSVIGLSTPENSYSPFIAKYLDYVSILRSSLLLTSKYILTFVDYQTTFRDKYTLMGYHGGIRMVYSCIGYGVMSFWAAFIIANKGSFKRKVLWVLVGLFALWTINVIRISLLILAIDKNWTFPFGVDHHTWFNIFAYLLIFVLIYLYDKSSNTQSKNSVYPKSS